MTAPGTLWIVATPIGNLEDMSARAVRVLGEASLVAAEDTRTTKKLLDRHGLETACVSLHEHSSPARIAELVERLRRGDSVAVVSEAGTPGLSDPGAALLAAALAAGVRVSPVPGPAAFVAALSASGLPMDRVAFEGFLPSKPKARRDALAALAREPRTMAFYEAPHRVAEALADMRNAFGPERRACVARELTKVHEEFERAGLGELADRWARREPRGEFTILVEGTPPETGVSGSDVESAVRAAMARGATVSETAREVSAALGCPRKLAYELALRLKGR